MKLTKLTLLPLITLFMFSTSCKKEEVEKEDPEFEFPSISENVDLEINSTSTTGEAYAFGFGVVTSVSIIDDNNNITSFSIREKDTGDYVLGSGSTNVVTHLVADNGTIYSSSSNSGSGTVKITKYDEENNLISGSLLASLYTNSNADSLVVEIKSFNDLPITRESMTAKVNGASWEATSMTGSFNGSKFNTRGTKADDGSDIQLGLDDFDEDTQTYNLSLDVFDSYLTHYSADKDNYIGTNGSIKIKRHIEHAKIIQGTFESDVLDFESNKTVEIKDGVFTVFYE